MNENTLKFYREKEDTAESDFPFQERFQEKLLATCNSSADGVLADRALSWPCPPTEEISKKEKKLARVLLGRTPKRRETYPSSWPRGHWCFTVEVLPRHRVRLLVLSPLRITTGTPGAFCQLHFPHTPLSSPSLLQ